MVTASKHDVAPAQPAITTAMWTQDLGREHGFEPLEIEGTLPPTLRGTLYRNGPGLFGQFGRRYTHPFEADGAITAVRIAGGQASGGARVHRTSGLARERAAGKLLYGLAAPWPRRFRNAIRNDQKNTANTNVMAWQGRLFALMEAAKPTEIDPATLATLGETDLGVIAAHFSAHPHHVPARRATYNFGLEYGRVTKLHVYELPDAGPARHLHAIELGGPPMLHDFIATDTHLVFFISPVRIDIARMLLQVGSFDKLFRWKPEHGTEIVCVPIDRPADTVRFTVDAFYQWHFANAFTRGGELVIDYVRYADFQSFYDIGAIGAGVPRREVLEGTLHRATIDLAAKRLRSEQVSDARCEFPTVAPAEAGREHARTFVALGELEAIGAIDARGGVVSHAVPADERITEPLHVDGYLLALAHGRDRAYVAVYDAERIPDGPVAKIHLDHHVPITFHGTFSRT